MANNWKATLTVKCSKRTDAFPYMWEMLLPLESSDLSPPTSSSSLPSWLHKTEVLQLKPRSALQDCLRCPNVQNLKCHFTGALAAGTDCVCIGARRRRGIKTQAGEKGAERENVKFQPSWLIQGRRWRNVFPHSFLETCREGQRWRGQREMVFLLWIRDGEPPPAKSSASPAR